MAEVLIFKSEANGEGPREEVGEYPTRFAQRVHELLAATTMVACAAEPSSEPERESAKYPAAGSKELCQRG